MGLPYGEGPPWYDGGIGAPWKEPCPMAPAPWKGDGPDGKGAAPGDQAIVPAGAATGCGVPMPPCGGVGIIGTAIVGATPPEAAGGCGA